MDWEFVDIANDFVPGLEPPGESEESYHIVVSDAEILTIDGVHPWRPLTQDEWRWLGLESVSELYLGHVVGTPVYACEVDPDAENPDGYEFETLRFFLNQVDEPTFNLIGRARQMVDWQRNHRYCGMCGKPTELSANDRSMTCKECNQVYYPRLSPSIIVLVTQGDRLLLAQNERARGNFYSTLAGFVEPGESIEEAVHREVFEEVGIRVKNLAYFGSQPWPFPNSLMIGFHAEYDGGDLVLQEGEIGDAQWFHVDELPNHPTGVSIAGRLIATYVDRLKQAGE